MRLGGVWTGIKHRVGVSVRNGIRSQRQWEPLKISSRVTWPTYMLNFASVSLGVLVRKGNPTEKGWGYLLPGILS